MINDYRIHLNFLSASAPIPNFRVYRRPRGQDESRPDDQTTSYSFAKGLNPNDREFFWVRQHPAEGFSENTTSPSENNDLTRWALFHALLDAIRRELQPDDYIFFPGGFLDEISLIMRRHAEGDELLVVHPYHLRDSNQFGCLADFHFRLNRNVRFSRRIQQLSLSLDRQFRRNLDYYIDRTAKITLFLKEKAALFSRLRLPGAMVDISLSLDFTPLPARRLRSKIYVFSNGRESKSQFTGLRDHGPLKPLGESLNLLFVFREQDRLAARTLALALRGSKGKERFSFPGFQALFKTGLAIDSHPVVLADLGEVAMSKALADVQERRTTDPTILPVVVLPEGDDNGYLTHKAGFTHAGIPTQVCTLRVIMDDNALKWAIANIALQIFCKAGGQPWKVRPSSEPTLIVGISQSHKLKLQEGKRIVDKYFAFTVMTDNSGLFQNIQVLGEAGTKADYLAELRRNLRQILTSGSQQFSRVVVHTSFKLKGEEINIIQKTVAEAAGALNAGPCRFAAVKVNQKCRFFGVNRQVNSLVPFEGTVVRLGFREYLAWFEGIFPDKPTVHRPFPGPTHLQFLRVCDEKTITDDELLQDLVNLSGGNWRGFNAKSAPVSVFYCHLVADVVHEFHELGLPLPEVQVFRPWFL